ncbi:hypothetical protein IFM89_026469 [Coptis chinensis]|uniref:Uncharacterized protein n=1 Tax=Coptis chinensis TaxID=261450 RepID=A0A835IFU4_9MAGN|nr:hypothetical protein IFM89_026469 [Coptis chinensis]
MGGEHLDEMTQLSSIGSSVIPIINKLQDVFAPFGDLSKIKLPQVAVIGSQSSGKSSVLEALVGRDFLPRGSDICTRRPLILQLENRSLKNDDGDDSDSDSDSTSSEWGEFLHLSRKRFYDFPAIRREIQAETEREAGSNKGVSDKPIRLKIYSPNVLNITLVDLPGITKISVGDQPRDIEAKIRKMIIGTNACNFLLGKVVPLHLGYIGIVNRSQAVYHGLSDRCGISQLAKKLNLILEQHIRTVLPGLKTELNSQMIAVLKDLRTYGEVTESKAGKGAVLLDILKNFCEAFSSLVDGKSHEMSTTELIGGARIHYVFQSTFVKSLEEVDPCDGLSDEDIRTAIQNATGPRNALFVPEVPFEGLVRKQIARLLDPSLQCLRFVYDELIKDLVVDKSGYLFMQISRACKTIEMQRFPVLRRRLDEVLAKFLRDSVKPAERMIGNFIEMELVKFATSPLFVQACLFPCVRNNYLSWSYAVEHFIHAKKKSKILTSDPPDSTDLTYEDWMASNSMVLTWLWNSMEPKVALLLNGLNSEYSVYKDQILASETVPSAAQAFSRLKRKRQEHGESLSVAKESSALLSTPSNRGGHGNYTSGCGSYGRGNYGNGRGNRGRCRGDRYDGSDERKCTHGHTEPFCLVPCEEVPPLPVVRCEEVPPLPVVPCEEVPSRVPITMKGTMPIYAQYHRTFPRKKVATIEPATITTIEPAPNHSSSSTEAPSIPVKSVAKRTRSQLETVAQRTSKAVEVATQQLRSSKEITGKIMAGEKLIISDCQKSRAILTKSDTNGFSTDQACLPFYHSSFSVCILLTSQELQSRSSSGKPISAGNSAGRSWPFSSIFGVGEPRMPSSESSRRKSYSESVPLFEQTSVIQLREPPAILRPSENQTEQEAVEIILIKLLLKSYYDIVRKNIQDLVPKAIMYFLVNHTKRDLLGTFIQNLYRENLFEEMLEEQEEVAAQRKRTQNMFQVLQQAVQTLEEVELEVSPKRSIPSSVTEKDLAFSRKSRLSSSPRSTANVNISSSASLGRNQKSRRLSYSGEPPLPHKSNGESHYSGNGVGYYILDS